MDMMPLGAEAMPDRERHTIISLNIGDEVDTLTDLYAYVYALKSMDYLYKTVFPFEEVCAEFNKRNLQISSGMTSYSAPRLRKLSINSPPYLEVVATVGLVSSILSIVANYSKVKSSAREARNDIEPHLGLVKGLVGTQATRIEIGARLFGEQVFRATGDRATAIAVHCNRVADRFGYREDGTPRLDIKVSEKVE